MVAARVKVLGVPEALVSGHAFPRLARCSGSPPEKCVTHPSSGACLHFLEFYGRHLLATQSNRCVELLFFCWITGPHPTASDCI